MTIATFEPLPLEGGAADAALLDALALFGLLRAAEDLLRAAEGLLRAAEDLLRAAEDLLEDPLRDPFELREVVCRLFDDRVLPWAMAPP